MGGIHTDRVRIGDRCVGCGEPTYIIAEIGSNFDQSLDRAKMLIDLAKSCGADAAKFQCFTADRIVSAEGFKNLKVGFQASWTKPVVEVYRDAELQRDWIESLVSHAKSRGIHFLATPYDLEAVDLLDEVGVPAFKIGSGDITWHELLTHVGSKGKPVILATGASTLDEVDAAVRVLREGGVNDIILLQCVTNYPSHIESSNIRAMNAMSYSFDLPVGYSDHTTGQVVPLGAVALGACVIEKHFTDDRARDGPDHPFALDGAEFKQMVDNIRLLEKSLGSPVKELQEEEAHTVLLQRRCLRAHDDIAAGTRITKEMIDVLRPFEAGALEPRFEPMLIDRVCSVDLRKGEPFKWDKIVPL
jgi:sialic acid synthase SpsE